MRPRSKITRSGHARRPAARAARAQRLGSPGASSTSAPPRRCGSASSSGTPKRLDLALEADEVARDELVQDLRPRALRHAGAVEQPRVQRRVAEPDPVVLQPGRVERRAQHGQRLGRALRPGRADELDPRLQDLARLPALRAHGAVGVRRSSRSAAAARRVGVAGGDHARDRDRHVRAQHEHVAVLVEELVGGVGRGRVAAREHLLVLQRGRRDLAVAARVEHAADRLGDRAQLAQLVRQDVARAATGSGGSRRRRARCCAPSARRRSSIRS